MLIDQCQLPLGLTNESTALAVIKWPKHRRVNFSFWIEF